jgi:uncharacterized membrane protein (DUF4010 family)
LLYRFGIAVAIGALVGMERESSVHRQRESDEVVPEGESDQNAIGVRTMTLVALGGGLAGLTALQFGVAALATALVVFGALLVAAYLTSANRGDLGLTSELGALCVFLLGALCVWGRSDIAGPLAVLVAIVLSLKQSLHSLARRVEREDVNAVLKFAVLSVVILPVLPQSPLRVGDYLTPAAVKAPAEEPDAGTAPVASSSEAPVGSDVQASEIQASERGDPPWWHEFRIHPRKIWLMVVLISGISFLGYFAGKVIGAERGLVVTAVVGGLASSTAVSLSYAQRSHDNEPLVPQFAIGILAANAIMPLRLLVVVGLVAPPLFLPLSIPLLAMVIVAGLSALFLARRHTARESLGEVQLKNPFEIGSALKFGLLFGAVLSLAHVIQGSAGQLGLYALAVVTGLTDVDAIGLATANLVRDGAQTPRVAAVAITIAALSNTVVKAFFVVSAGSTALRKLALGAFGLMTLAAAAGVGGLLLWG